MRGNVRVSLDFCRIIKKIRLRHGLSHEKIAEILGVTRMTIIRWEVHGTVPDANMLISAMIKFPELRDHIIGVTYLLHCDYKK